MKLPKWLKELESPDKLQLLMHIITLAHLWGDRPELKALHDELVKPDDDAPNA